MEHCKYNTCVDCYPKRVAVNFCESCGFHPEEQKRRKEYAQSRAQAIERDRKHSVLSIRIRRQKNGKNRFSTLAVKKRTRSQETDIVYKKQQPVQKSTDCLETD